MISPGPTSDPPVEQRDGEDAGGRGERRIGVSGRVKLALLSVCVDGVATHMHAHAHTHTLISRKNKS